MSNTGTTNFPTGYDAYDNPVAGVTLENQSGYSHAALHSQVHDAIEAIETSLGTHAVGTAVFAKRNNETFGTPYITGGTLTGMTINSGALGTPAITGGSITAGFIGTPQITGGTIALNTFNADGESDITITPGTAKTVRIRTPRQDITTNTYPANTVIQHGWTFTLSQNTNVSVAKTVTFPRAFTAVPSVAVTHIGYKDGSDPTTASDFTQNGGYFPEVTIGTASFVVETAVSGGTIPSGRRCGVSWIAIGAS